MTRTAKYNFPTLTGPTLKMKAPARTRKVIRHPTNRTQNLSLKLPHSSKFETLFFNSMDSKSYVNAKNCNFHKFALSIVNDFRGLKLSKLQRYSTASYLKIQQLKFSADLKDLARKLPLLRISHPILGNFRLNIRAISPKERLESDPVPLIVPQIGGPLDRGRLRSLGLF